MKQSSKRFIIQLLALGLFCVLVVMPQKVFAGAEISFTTTDVTLQDGCCQVTGYFTNNGDMAAEITKSEITVTIKDKDGNVIASVTQSFDMGGMYVWSGSPRHTYYLYSSSFKAPKEKFYWNVRYYNWWDNVRPIGM